MKILWLVNILLPEAQNLLFGKGSIKGTGGWLVASASSISYHSNIRLIIASAGPVTRLTKLQGERITYYLFPPEKSIQRYKPIMAELYQVIKPDVVHIHGTEQLMGCAYAKVNPVDNIVVSIQGFMDVISRYDKGGLNFWDIASNLTFRDVVLHKTIWDESKESRNIARCERDLLIKVKYVIGRTTMDKSHATAINPTIQYFHCNESLRESFYDGRWFYDSCDKHTIFISQFHCPLKGLHFLLKAMPIILEHFPDAKIVGAGWDILHCDTLLSKVKKHGYARYLNSLIVKYGLQGRFHTTGSLDETGMKQALLRANVYVCPSSIENSPNSLGEAQMLGVPCVASYVGGIPDMIPNKQCGRLYRFDDPEMLAYQIIEAFEESEIFDNSVERRTAAERHDRNINSDNLMHIYNTIYEKTK